MAITLSAYNDLGTTTEPTEMTPRKPLLQRVGAWIENKYRQDRDAEIAAFVAERGGTMTDSMEREIGSRYGSMAG
jgi:hypothetical protein